jgi:hypothetical protein
MSYLPPSSLYLHEPEPPPRPQPHPEPHREREPEAHLEPLRLTERVPLPPAPPIPAAPPMHTYVTSPSIPHTVERIIDPPLPRTPTMPPMSPAMTPPPHVVEHVTERVLERPNEAPQVIERVVERFVERPPEPTPPPHVVEHVTERVLERPNEAPQVIERVVERIIEQPPEPPPPPQVVERIIERVIERPPPEPVRDVAPPAPTPAPVLSSAMPPLHAVKGPKDWLVASPPEFLVEELVEPRRIHVEQPLPEPVPEPRLEERHEPRHEPRREERPEPRREPRHEPKHEPKPVHAARPEPETRPAAKAKRHFLHRAHGTVMRHLKRDKSQPPEPGDKELLWMAASALGSVCFGLMIWGAYSTLPRPGYGGGLRAEATSPKFKVVSGEYGPGRYEPTRSPRFEGPPVLTGLPGPVHLTPPPLEQPRRIVETPQFQIPPPEKRIEPIQVERALDALPRRVDPAIFVKANLGDTPMIRTWDNLAKYSMMLTAMAAMPVTPIVPQAFAQPMPQVLQPPPQAPAVDYSKQIDALTQAVNRLTTDVNRLKEIDDKLEAVRTDVSKQIARIKVEPHDDSEIKLQLAAIQKTLKFLLENPQAAPVAAPGVAAAPSPANTTRIESELVSIKEAILKLRPNDRLALSPPDMTPPAIVKTARIVFVNLYDKDLYLWVNDKKHRVEAQKTITVEGVAPGAANIDVKSDDKVYHHASPTLAANETYTLTAR